MGKASCFALFLLLDNSGPAGLLSAECHRIENMGWLLGPG